MILNEGYLLLEFCLYFVRTLIFYGMPLIKMFALQ